MWDALYFEYPVEEDITMTSLTDVAVRLSLVRFVFFFITYRQRRPNAKISTYATASSNRNVHSESWTSLQVVVVVARYGNMPQ